MILPKNYGPVLAKVRVGKGKLLDKQKYNAILYAENFHIAISYLNNTDYWNYLSKFSQKEPTTLEIERTLFEYYYDELNKCIKYSPEEGKIFLNLLHDHELISMLADLLSSKYYRVEFKSFHEILTREIFLGKKKLSYEKTEVIVDLLQEKSLVPKLKQLILENENDINHLILQIKYIFWKTFLELIKEKIGRQTILTEIFRMQLLKENIMLILRLKSMGAPNYLIKQYITPFSIIEKKIFEKLLSTTDIKTFATSAVEEYQGILKEFIEKIPNFETDELEIEYNKTIARKAYEVFLAYPFQPDIAYGYIILKRYEIEDLMNMLKAKLLNISIENLKKVLILPIFF
ncbi:MAG: V-type ATPase subunit [Nitrososphaeria archaeon]|nr:V-type ATPase subunit [Nitrososphaeria archaeon]